jgi:hypothetical protein
MLIGSPTFRASFANHTCNENLSQPTIHRRQHNNNKKFRSRKRSSSGVNKFRKSTKTGLLIFHQHLVFAFHVGVQVTFLLTNVRT